VGYGEELAPDDVVKYDLIPVVHEKSDSTIYLEEATDEEGLGDLRGIQDLDAEASEDGKTPGEKRPSGVSSESGGGASEGGVLGPGVSSGHGSTSGEGNRGLEVDQSTDGEGEEEALPGSDALQPTMSGID